MTAKVHPIFQGILETMNDRVPERPLQPPHHFDESIPFDETDDGIMHDVMGNHRLAKPVQALLLTLRSIKMFKDSFGADDSLVVKALMPDLEALREACADEYKDL